jgi:hypothetical protein
LPFPINSMAADSSIFWSAILILSRVAALQIAIRIQCPCGHRFKKPMGGVKAHPEQRISDYRVSGYRQV